MSASSPHLPPTGPTGAASPTSNSNSNKDDEERLREKLKSKSHERRRSNSNNEPTHSSRSHSRSRSRSRERRRGDAHAHPHHSRSHLSHSRPHHHPGRRGEGRPPHRGPPHPHHHRERRPHRDDAQYRDRPPYDDFGRQRKRHSRSRSRSRSSSSRSSSSGSSRSSDGSDESSLSSGGNMQRESPLTKDQRTVFVNQLVQRATERELRKYLVSNGFPVNEVILLRDKRTGRHKGCAYVELSRLEHVQPCIEQLNDKPPDFQRFPILIKASEAEKNYVAPTTTIAKAALATTTTTTPAIVSQKVYIGGLSPSVTQEHLIALFQPFGSLQSVQMQIDTTTQQTKGYCFLQFLNPQDANLCIQSMTGQTLAGKPLKTGWANQAGGVTSDEFPDNAAQKTQAAYSILKQLNLGQAVPMPSRTVLQAAPPPGTVAEARASLAAASATTVSSTPVATMLPTVSASVVAPTTTIPPQDPDASIIGNAQEPTHHVLIRNMFDKDTETQEGWEKEIQDEFEDEATKFGTLTKSVVMSQEPGGKIYASFSTVEAATKCAQGLAGRWFDKRQLRVEFVKEEDVPKKA